jgi:hypothetical protein
MLKGCPDTQSRMLHGLLTEEPPKDSLVYGSRAYWELVKSDIPDKGWLIEACKAQEQAEERCGRQGLVPWMVQRPDGMSEEMKKKVVVPVQKGSLLEKFPKIRTMYEESEKAPEKVEIDACSIRKEVYDDISVWISAEGHVFDCDTTGEPGEFMGMMIDGDLVVSK